MSLAELPAKVLFVTSSVPELASPPPWRAELPVKVLSVMVSTPPEFMRPPPKPLAVLPERMQLVMISVPWLKMPPPESAVCPALMVTPSIVAVTPLVTRNTRLVPLPLMVNCSAPGPAIVKSLFRTNAPLVRRIVPLTLNMMVSPGCAVAIARRSDPGPLSEGSGDHHGGRLHGKNRE